MSSRWEQEDLNCAFVCVTVFMFGANSVELLAVAFMPQNWISLEDKFSSFKTTLGAVSIECYLVWLLYTITLSNLNTKVVDFTEATANLVSLFL